MKYLASQLVYEPLSWDLKRQLQPMTNDLVVKANPLNAVNNKCLCGNRWELMEI